MRRPITLPALLVTTVTTLAAVAAVTLSGSSAGAGVDRAASPAPPAATRVVHVRPVTVSGRPSPGWTVRREAGTVSCSGTAPSAVNPGITSCFPTAYGLSACFKSGRHTVLCVRDARVRELVRMRYSGAYPKVDGPARPQPINLELTDGRQCLIRTGGAWSSPRQHPRWVGYYSCNRRAGVYAPGAGLGINTTRDLWTAQVWRSGPDPQGRHLVTRGIARVYVVGVAAD
jgi:hypothetical protein